MNFNEYQLSKWRRLALVRDGRIAGVDQGYCCMCIETKETSEIEMHHIYPKSLHPEKAYLLDNAISLCLMCHQGIVHSERNNKDLGNWRFFVPAFRYYQRLAAVRDFNIENQSRLWTPPEAQ